MLLVVAGGTQLCRLVALQTQNVNKVKMFFLMFKGEKFLCQMVSNGIFVGPVFKRHKIQCLDSCLFSYLRDKYSSAKQSKWTLMSEV